MSNLPPRGSGGRDTRIFFVYFEYKILHYVHSLAPKMGITGVFIKTPMHWEIKTVGRGCRMRPEEPKIEAKGGERGGVLGEGAASSTS